MRNPTPRKLLRWAVLVAEQARAARPAPTAFYANSSPSSAWADRRDEALTVLLLAEKVAGADGLRLLVAHYVDGGRWETFTERERRTIRTAARRFAGELRARGMLEAA